MTTEPDFSVMREAMIDSQLRTSGINTPAITARMRAVARENFVPQDRRSVCYMDRSLALGGGRSLNPPVTAGLMLQHAQPLAGDKALLVAAGTGYLAALLSPMVASLVALEEEEKLAKQAAANLEGLGNVTLATGALTAGHAAGAPYDLILIDGAIDLLPETLVAQLADGGRIITGVQNGPVTSLALGIKRGGQVALRNFADASIAPLPAFAKKREFAF